MKLNIIQRAVPLADAPVGLFLWRSQRDEDILGFKSEYTSRNGRVEAFIVESGEYFWGGVPATIEHQRNTLVQPVEIEEKDVVDYTDAMDDRIRELIRKELAAPPPAPKSLQEEVLDLASRYDMRMVLMGVDNTGKVALCVGSPDGQGLKSELMKHLLNVGIHSVVSQEIANLQRTDHHPV